MGNLSPVSDRRARFLTQILTERAAQERRWSTQHDRAHTRLEWAGLLAHYALRVWSSDTPRHALVQLAALALAATEALDADPEQLTDLEEAQRRGVAAGTPDMFARINNKLAKLKGGT